MSSVHISVFLLFAVVFSVNAQGYTETYSWPGPLVIPDDGRNIISTGAILVQLPSNTTSNVTREVRIGSQVNLTMDCGPHIDFEKSRIPANLPTTQRTIWYHVEKDLDGNFLATNTTVIDSVETDIFGPDSRFLRIAMPTFTVPAKQGNAGLCTCRFCHAVSIGQFTKNEFCADQSIYVNVIGISPMIDRTVAAPGGIVIGTTICLDEISDEITITCSQNSTNQPELEPRATFLIDGQQQTNYIFENPIIDLPGEGDIVSFFLQAYILDGNPEPRTIKCFLNNTFGSDMETSLFLRKPTLTSFTGSIEGSISNGCDGIRPSNVICPSKGQTVNLNCATNSTYSTINITSPNGTVTSPTFIAESGLFGTYTCTVSNDCGQTRKTFIVEECKFPEVTVSGSISNISGDGCIIPSNGQKICAIEDEETVTIYCATDGTDYIIEGPQRKIRNQPLTFTVENSDYGTYYCNSSNICGHETESFIVERSTRDPDKIYTEVFKWPGPICVPDDDDRKFISMGRILVEVPNNTSHVITREVKIGTQVNLTLDCGPHIDYEKSQIPSGQNVTQRTVWFHVGKNINGEFVATNTTVVDSTETDIFGPDSRYLRIAMPTFGIRAKQGNAGLYTCRFCYTENLNQEVCIDQNINVNVIDKSPMIDRNVSAPGGIVIGTTICLDGATTDEIIITCSQNSTNQPEFDEPRAMFLLDGQQQPDYIFDNPIIDLPGTCDIVSVLLQTYIDLGNPEPHTITCFLNNTFGSDMETSLILRRPTVTSFTGSIQGSISNGCNGTRPSNVICPSEGQTVNLNCTTNSIYNTINITGPNGAVYINTSPTFIAESELFGTYTCTVSNDCGQQTQIFILEEQMESG